jgi:hypothetical protein
MSRAPFDTSAIAFPSWRGRCCGVDAVQKSAPFLLSNALPRCGTGNEVYYA